MEFCSAVKPRTLSGCPSLLDPLSFSARHLSHTVQSIPPSGIRAFFDLVASHPNAISLSIGEPDFATPWAAREAAIYAIERGRTAYSSTFGLPELRREVADYLKRRFGLRCDWKSEILITVGVSQGLDIALRAILNPGDEVIVVEPSYVAYSPLVTLAGGRAVPLKTRSEDGWRIDPQNLTRLITKKTRALLTNSPSNPTGFSYPPEDMEMIAALAKQHDFLILSDEIYAELTYEGEHASQPAIGRSRGRTLLLSGMSKSWAMTGWRVGYACGPAPLIAAMAKLHQYTMLSVPTPSQWAALEALRSGTAEVAAMRDAYCERRNLLLDGFQTLGLPCVRPRGAFYAFPSIAQTGLTSQEFARRLLLEQGVAVVPGDAFGASGAGHIRCAYANSLTKIEEALNRLEQFLRTLRKRPHRAKAK